MLKIIGGSARGRNLQSLPKHFPVRPILARIKKSLFDILQSQIAGTQFLDLYAGTGAVGIEALSRGAAHAVFVEQNADCLKVIQSNLENLKLKDKATVVRADIAQGLSFLPKPFDIIFMGPPYKDQEKKPLALVHPTLDVIVSSELLAKDGLIIAQHHKKESVVSSSALQLYRQESYGDSLLSFFRFS